MKRLRAKPDAWVLVTHEYSPFHGGAAVYLAETAAALHASGERISVWAPDYGSTWRTRQLDGDPVYVERFAGGGTLRWKDLARFARAIWLRRAELAGKQVILGSVGAHIAFFFLMSLGSIRCGKIISLLHGSEVLRFQANPVLRFLGKRFYKRVDRVITVSEYSRDLITDSFLKIPRDQITIAPGAASTAAKRVAIADLRVDRKLVVLTLARIHPRKGQLHTALALAELPLEMRSQIVYQLAGVGDARYLASVATVCRKAGIAFEYLGEVGREEIPNVYAGCDIFVMSSRRLARSVEGFGLTYLEAAFHGKPVVGYRSGGVGDAVRDGETGFLAKEGDVPELARQLQRLISDPQLRRQIGQAGRRWAGRFNWQQTAHLLTGRNEPG